MLKRFVIYVLLSGTGFLLKDVVKKFRIFLLFPFSISLFLHLYMVFKGGGFSLNHLIGHLSFPLSILSHINLIFKLFSFLAEILRFLFSVTAG